MNDIKFGKCLKKIRKKYNFSKEYVADTLKVSDKFVSEWESGRVMPNDEYIEKLSLLYGVNLYKKENKNVILEVIIMIIIFIFSILYIRFYYLNKYEMKEYKIYSYNGKVEPSGKYIYAYDNSYLFIDNIKYNGDAMTKKVTFSILDNEGNLIEGYTKYSETEVDVNELLKKVKTRLKRNFGNRKEEKVYYTLYFNGRVIRDNFVLLSFK